MTTLSPKYDSFIHSALHYLCNAGWGNESDGDANDYGSYFTRITLETADVAPQNTEFISLIEEWPDFADAVHPGHPDEFFRQLVGHWLVAEDSQGFVHVRQFDTVYGVKWRFDQFAAHYAAFAGDDDD